MTENEAIKELSYDNTAYGGRCTEEVRRVAIHALSEIQQYRAIGTVEDIQLIFSLCKDLQDVIKQYELIGTIEEFKALKGKNEPKKVAKIVKTMNAFTEWGKYECPCCKNYLGNLNEYSYPNYCYKCGTEIDWQ